MDNTLQLIELYSTGFNVCMVIAIAGAALALFLFFKLDIRGIYMIQSGRARRKEIRNITEKNRKTDKLRKKTGTDGAKVSKTAPLDSEKFIPDTAPLTESTKQQTEGQFRFVITEHTAVTHTDEIIG